MVETLPDAPQLWFRFAGVGRRRNILDFWRWALWDVRRAEIRGLLAQYFVAMALGIDDAPRTSDSDALPCGHGQLRVRAALSREPSATAGFARNAAPPDSATARPSDTKAGSLPAVFQTGPAEEALATPWVFCLVAPSALQDPLDAAHWSFCPAAGAPLAQALGSGRQVTPARLAAAGLTFVSFDQLSTLLEPSSPGSNANP